MLIKMQYLWSAIKPGVIKRGIPVLIFVPHLPTFYVPKSKGSNNISRRETFSSNVCLDIEMFNSSKFYMFRAHNSFQNSFILISFVTTLRVTWSHHSPVSSGKTSSGGCSPGLFVTGRKDKVQEFWNLIGYIGYRNIIDIKFSKLQVTNRKRAPKQIIQVENVKCSCSQFPFLKQLLPALSDTG